LARVLNYTVKQIFQIVLAGMPVQPSIKFMKAAPLLGLALLVQISAQAAMDTARIESLTGLKGTLNEAEGVFKVTAPRNDVPIKVDGWAMPPFMGLTSWAAFTDGKKTEAMCAGDLVLFEDEVTAVMRAALDAGLGVTALHNHFFADEPKVYFMHIGGEGTVDKLGTAVKAALARAFSARWPAYLAAPSAPA